MRRGWGTGSIYQRSPKTSDGRWVAAVRVKGRQVVRYGRTRAEATRLLREMSDHPRPERTVEDQLRAWYRGRKPSLRPSSARRYESVIRAELGEHGRYMTLRLDELDSGGVADWRDAMLRANLGARAVRLAMTVLRMALKSAEADGLIPRNPAASVALPRLPVRSYRTLTPEQVRTLIDTPHDLRHLWLVMALCGLRIGEALALRWQDVDTDDGMLHVRGTISEGRRQEPKTKAGRRTLSMPAPVCDALREVREPTGPVFPGRMPGKPILSPTTAARLWHDHCAATGLPRLRLHDLRHTCATLLLEGGAPLDTVKRYMGHATIAVTSDIYGHGRDDGMPGVAAIMEERLGGDSHV